MKNPPTNSNFYDFIYRFLKRCYFLIFFKIRDKLKSIVLHIISYIPRKACVEKNIVSDKSIEEVSIFDVDEINSNEFNQNLPELLIIVHETARTGAPILGLNLIWSLLRFYKITVFILDKNGILFEKFLNSGAYRICGASVRGNAEEAHRALNSLIGESNFEFAIANSIESSLHVLPVLAKNKIFTINLIHEFTSCYVNKIELWRFMTDWAGEFVFSSELTREDALAVAPISARARSCVIPQGICLLPNNNKETNMADELNRHKFKLLLRPDIDNKKDTLIVGLGSIHLRKGVDLFIQAAAEIIKQDPNTNYRFIWFGKSYETGLNWGYDAFLSDQIRRLNLSEDFNIYDETEYLDIVYEEADFILLTSRLDPLPNVALDGMNLGIPVFCFKNATGIAEYLESTEPGKNCVSPYLDVKNMALNVVNVNSNKDLLESIISANKELANKHFNFNLYSKKLISFKKNEQVRSQENLEWLNTNGQSKVDREFFLSRQFNRDIKTYLPVGFDENNIDQLYLYTWRNTHLRRKPTSGFHPGIYAEDNSMYRGMDPYAHFLKSGSPEGRWAANCIKYIGSDLKKSNSHEFSVAIHIHVYYLDILKEILDRVLLNKIRPDIFITLSNDVILPGLNQLISNFPDFNIEIILVENRGRNLRPLFKDVGPLLWDKYEYIVHLHTKKSPHADPELVNDWRNFMFDLLVGGDDTKGMMDRIFSGFLDMPNVGLIFPSDPNIIGWDLNLPYALEIAKNFQINHLKDEFNFPVGGMFWIKASALKVFNGLSEKYFPVEPLPSDGSYLHALERLMPALIEKDGYEYALVTASEITR
jgi:glycosyltransferase involved in cell wall biosynthesis